MRRLQLIGFVLLMLFFSLSPAPPVRIAIKPAAVATGWTTYHRDNTRNGFDPSGPVFPASGVPGQQWTTSLDSNVYAEPLALGGVVFAATENNSIYALDEVTGTAIWRWHQFASVSDPASAVGCGNINPVGITGTPVIDPAAGIIYAVGLVTAVSTTDKYQLFAVHIADGSNVTGFPRDIATSVIDPIYDENRASLALSPDGNTVYAAFGGWAGDCVASDGHAYHPIVVAVPVSAHLGQAQIVYQPQAAGQVEAGIWSPSGISIDASGNVYVATGNGGSGSSTLPCNNSTWDHGNAVIKLSPTLAELSTWAPSNWCTLSDSDTDIGSVGPMLIQGGQIFQAGKGGDGYILNSASLGGFAGEIYSNHIAMCPTSDAVFGGYAYSAPYIYVPCDNYGLVALKEDTTVTPNAFTVAWKATGFTPTAPIVAGGVVWTMGSTTLFGFDAITGAQRFSIPIGGHTHFATPTEDNGWLLVPQQTSVAGFAFGISWQSLGGSLTSGGGPSSCAAGNLNVYVLGGDGVPWYKHWNGTTWSGWTLVGGNVMSNPASVCEPGTTTTHLFTEGQDNHLWHRVWNGTSFAPWVNLGGSLTSGPGASSCAANNADVFVLGGDGVVWRKTWNGTAWSGWLLVGGNVGGNPAAVCEPGTSVIHLFVEGTDGRLYHRTWTGSAWLPWDNLGGSLTSSAAAVSCAAGQVDAFVNGGDGVLWRKTWNGSTWSGWIRIGGSWTSDPGAVCQPGTTKIDLFERGGDGALWTIELPS